MRQPAPLLDLGAELGGGPLARPLWRGLERLLGVDGVNRLYAEIGGRGLGPQEFCRQALATLQVESWIEPQGLQRLAELKGPVLVAANHPLGGRDALLLNVVLGTVRPDYRILSNRVMGRIPETRSKLLLVDPFGGPSAAAFNRAALREALRFLGQGGLLGVFPAGEVSYWQSQEGKVADPAWAPQAVRLALASQAQVVPLHIQGDSSAWLRALARIHPALKTPWLARELIHGPAKRLEARLGAPIPALRLLGRRPEAQAAWLRERTYELAAG